MFCFSTWWNAYWSKFAPFCPRELNEYYDANYACCCWYLAFFELNCVPLGTISPSPTLFNPTKLSFLSSLNSTFLPPPLLIFPLLAYLALAIAPWEEIFPLEFLYFATVPEIYFRGNGGTINSWLLSIISSSSSSSSCSSSSSSSS
jgi:hypothetical protein